VIVIARIDDREAVAAARPSVGLPARLVTVDRPGQVAALNAGLLAASGVIIAITDDDAAPRPDWLERIERHFVCNPLLGGVGGRDWVTFHGSRPEHARRQVGIVRPWGRLVGNHHLGTGPPRTVDVLKGSNMSFRREALSEMTFDERLAGGGAQVHNDLMLSLSVRRKRWLLVYDPLVAVDHFPAPRAAGHVRGDVGCSAIRDAVHNETLALVEFLSWPRRLLFFVWSLLVGTRYAPGIAQLPRLAFQRERNILERYIAAQHGRMLGWRRFFHDSFAH